MKFGAILEGLFRNKSAGQNNKRQPPTEAQLKKELNKIESQIRGEGAFANDPQNPHHIREADFNRIKQLEATRAELESKLGIQPSQAETQAGQPGKTPQTEKQKVPLSATPTRTEKVKQPA